MSSTLSARASLASRLAGGRALPIITVTAALLLVWYVAAVWLNAPQLVDRYTRANEAWDSGRLVRDAWAMDRPLLPAPHQILLELKKTVVDVAPSSRRSLLWHGWVTLSSTLLGFLMGTALGIALAAAIVHSRTLDRSLMPWLITSQTVPILAVAPMVIVVLGSIGIKGLLPKAVIGTYLSFFPVAIGMVKGLRSPQPIELDLMRTYSATRAQTLRLLRWPASLPFLFPSLKVGIAASLLGAIVGELPTGAQAGLGARLLTGSYYGQTIQIWAALVMASALAGLLVAAIGLTERLLARGRQP